MSRVGVFGVLDGFSGSGTNRQRMNKPIVAMRVMRPKIPDNPAKPPKNGAMKKAPPKAIPILAPIPAFALVRTSGLVRSAIKAKTAELMAPAP